VTPFRMRATILRKGLACRMPNVDETKENDARGLAIGSQAEPVIEAGQSCASTGLLSQNWKQNALTWPASTIVAGRFGKC
jgi:hypothetical protein